MKRIYTSLFLIFFFICAQLKAQWLGNAVTGGIPLCNAATVEEEKLSVSDGANGSIVIFSSSGANDLNPNPKIYAQRINSSGQVQWGTSANPKPVCVVTGDKTLESILPDGDGGAYISWYIYKVNTDSSNLFLQHINSSGNPLWTINGVQVNANNNREVFSGSLVSDGGTGVIVVWSESVFDEATQLTTYGQSFAQKYSSAGVAQWAAGGVQLCLLNSFSVAGSVLADGSGGIIASLTDTRNSTQLSDDTFTNLDIYAQKLSSTGVRQWSNSGIAVNTAAFNQQNIGVFLQTNSVVPDGAGGMIFLFNDYTNNNDGNGNIFAQRINSSGVRQWAAGGVPVCTADSAEFLASALPDGAGGMVVFWSDDRNGGFFNSAYFAQRVLANGTTAWTTNGIKLFDTFGSFGSGGLDAKTDGAGNYTYVWSDFATGTLKAQKINNSGAEQWGVDGKDVCTNPDASPFYAQLVSSDAGQLIVTWIDSRNINTNTDIYAAKLTTSGDLVNGGVVSSSFITAANGNWNSPATWVGGVVPISTSDCIVRHTVSITANTSCKSLRIEKPNGNLTVNTNIRFTILQ